MKSAVLRINSDPSLFKGSVEDELTSFEKDTIVSEFVNVLLPTDEQHKLYGKDLIDYFQTKGHKLDRIRVCKWVSYARQKNLFSPKVLVGSSKGYFITDNILIVDKQLESLRSRQYGIQIAYDSVLAQRQNLIFIQKGKNFY